MPYLENDTFVHVVNVEANESEVLAVVPLHWLSVSISFKVWTEVGISMLSKEPWLPMIWSCFFKAEIVNEESLPYIKHTVY